MSTLFLLASRTSLVSAHAHTRRGARRLPAHHAPTAQLHDDETAKTQVWGASFPGVTELFIAITRRIFALTELPL